MDLNEIVQCSHKIKKIYITNKNKVSDHTSVIVKITLDDKNDDETVRFSLEENRNWLTHQSNNNDYFMEIPNKKNSTITLYAHYFPTILYDYLEEQQIFSIYDWSELFDDISISQYHNTTYHINDGEVFVNPDFYLTEGNKLYINGEEYIITNEGVQIDDNIYYIRQDKLIINGRPYIKNIDSEDYQYELDNNNKLVVRSKLSGSITGFKDPNYKNYTKLINDNEEYSNVTEQGFFPLSSRYRNSRYTNAPIINMNPLPYWSDSSTNTQNCINRENQSPYWEAKIHKDGLSPLISENSSINVYFNYQYLPSSTEYHQHYYGFAPNNSTDSTFQILDGENLTTINKGFKESTYRIINKGNPFDNSHILTVAHDKKIPIDLTNGMPKKDENNEYTCIWERNKCDDYWVYTPKGKGDVSINIELEEDQPYKLQYYMYIPSDSVVEDDSCTVCIQHFNENGELANIDELNDDIKNILLKQDKILRDQWIYHEIDFRAQDNNRICIKGPQHKKTDKIIHNVNGQDYPKESYELVNDDKVFFTNFNLVKMVEYSPTLKYNDTGVYLIEQDQWTAKSNSEKTSECVKTPDIEQGDKWKTKQKPLPIPIKDVYIIFDDDFDILYNKITSELSWTAGIEDCAFSFIPYDEYNDENLEWQTDDEEISLIYDILRETNNFIEHLSDDTGVMKLYRKQHKTFTTGANNSFSLRLQDSQGNKITSGTINCAIVKTAADDGTYTEDEEASVTYLGEQTPDENGRVEYNNLNFKHLQPTSNNNVTYFLRTIYENKCYEKKIVNFKPLIFEKEHRNMNAYINVINDNICKQSSNSCKLCATSEYDVNEHKYVHVQLSEQYRKIKSVEELPLRIDTNIYNQLNIPLTEGYCELSINDKVVQSTIIDNNGTADFYIDYDDIYDDDDTNHNNIQEQTIKIEYFNKYNESINYLYFTIIYDMEEGYDSRPAIPIKLYSISGDSLEVFKTHEYHLNEKDIFMLNIDTEDNINFSITIILNGVELQKKYIYDNDTFIVIGKYDDVHTTDTYTIITDNINPNDSDGKYRKYTRSFDVVWDK